MSAQSIPAILSRLSNQGRIDDAFRAIERARGRIEAQGISDHALVIPQQPTPTDLRLTALNVQLLDTDDPVKRSSVLDEIYTAEQQLSGQISQRVPNPVSLTALQKDLLPSDLFIEYVLDEPISYALAVTNTTVRRYELPAKDQIERDSAQYRSEIIKRATDTALAQKLFQELLAPNERIQTKAQFDRRTRRKTASAPDLGSRCFRAIHLDLACGDGGALGVSARHAATSDHPNGSRRTPVCRGGSLDVQAAADNTTCHNSTGGFGARETRTSCTAGESA